MTEHAAADFLAPETMQRPFGFYDDARKTAPVMRLPKSPVPGRDVYLVTSYELVTKIGRDWRTFSNRFGFMMNQASDDAEITEILSRGQPWVDTLLTQDPPLQRQYRALVMKIFSPARVEAMAESMTQICDQLIDSFVGRGECDFFEDFAVPLPIYVIADQLGVSRVDREDFKRWTDEYVASIGSMHGRDAAVAGAKAVVAIQDYFIKVIADRRETPRNDIVSDLANAMLEDGRALTIPELCSILHQLLVAGNETTRNALAGGMVHILGKPGLKEAMALDHALIPPAVEEILRLETPTKSMWRIATRDVEIGGVAIPADALLLLSFDAGNRDPIEFGDPDDFVPGRPNAGRHLSFGGGIHFCIGALLARREMAIAYERLFARLPRLRLTEERNELRYISSILHRAFTGLHLSFDVSPANG